MISAHVHINHEDSPEINCYGIEVSDGRRVLVLTIGDASIFATLDQLHAITKAINQAIAIEETIPFDDDPEQEAV